MNPNLKSFVKAHFRPIQGAILCAVLSVCQSLSAAPSYPQNDVDSLRDRQYQRVRADIAEQHYEAAIATLRTLIAQDANDADAYNLMGFSLRKLKQYQNAENNYRQALKINPEHRGALNYMGQLFVETGRPDQARELLKRLDELCFLPCKEYSELERIVEAERRPVESRATIF